MIKTKNTIVSFAFMALSILSYGNVKSDTKTLVKADDIDLQNTSFTHLIMYGQSLSTGHEAGTTLSAENVLGNYMLGKQVWLNYGNTNTLEIHPLVGHPSFADPDNLIEPPIMGAANHIQKKIGNLNIIATSVGVSGRTIEDLSKESEITNFYDDFIRVLKRGAVATSRLNSTINCSGIFWLQGEFNYTPGSGLTNGSTATTTKEGYKALLVQLKNNMQADVKTQYAQPEAPVLYTYQTGAQYTKGKTLNIGMAQLEASNEFEDIVCTGPVYPMTDYGGHLDANGYRWYGEMIGKIYYKHAVLGEDFKPLQPKKVYRDKDNDKIVIIQFLVPKPPLVLDTKTLVMQLNYGFEIYMNNVKQSIQKVRVVNTDCVEITCAAPLTGDVEVVYAGENTSGHGNLRDSDDYQAFFNYVDIDKRDDGGNFIYPRKGNKSLRPYSAEPRDENGNIIYDKPYPLYNFSVAFYYKLGNNDEIDILLSTNNIKASESSINILQQGSKLLIDSKYQGDISVKLFDIAGKLHGDFIIKNQHELSLSFLNKGIYIVSVQAGDEKLNCKICV